MIIDVDADRCLVFSPNGEDGKVFVVTKTGRVITIEERDGMIWFDGRPTTTRPTIKTRQ